MNKNYYSPLPESTKYQFGITNSSYDGLEMIEVFREGKNFYLQQVEEETELLGDIRDLGRYLYENNAEWLVERKKKLRRRILFLNKQQALELLRDGVPVFHLDSDQIFSYSEDYEELLSSVTGKISELLPGIYMVAIGEPYNEKTYKEVQKENEAARRLRRKFAQAKKVTTEKVADAKPQEVIVPNADEKSGGFFKAVGFFLGGAFVGALFGLGMSNSKY